MALADTFVVQAHIGTRSNDDLLHIGHHGLSQDGAIASWLCCLALGHSVPDIGPQAIRCALGIVRLGLGESVCDTFGRFSAALSLCE
jgi:hypothetical protein